MQSRRWSGGFIAEARKSETAEFDLNQQNYLAIPPFRASAINPGKSVVDSRIEVHEAPSMPLTKAELQRLRSLREKKSREELGLFVVEGEKVVGELVAAGFRLEQVYYSGNGDAATSPHLADHGTGVPRPPFIEITAAEMARISHFPTPSTVFAVGRIMRTPLAAGALDHGLTLALDGVQDAGNVGTLLRIADWFGLDRVVLSADCANLFHQKVINASMGSFARVRAHVADLPGALAAIQVPVLGCDLKGDDVHGISGLRNAVIVIGSEGSGLSPAVKRCVTRFVTIPRFGGAESLNAAVAAAIVCDNLRRLTKS